MKQILCRILVLLVVVAAILGLSSCNIFIEQEVTSYELVVNSFEREVIYGTELDFSGLEIEATTGDDVKHIPVNSSMIVSGDTKTVGAQELVIEYGGFSWTLAYEVFYKVEHIVDGFVYDSQLVSSRDEILYVKDPEKNGSIFLGWSIDMPETLTGNVRREAVFVDNITLPKLSATYGDTLGDITLPTVSGGKWSWQDSVDTPVGNAGTNEFKLVYTFDDTSKGTLTFDVDVEVAKKHVDISVLDEVFEYNGNENTVRYELSEAVPAEDIICFGDISATEIGKYSYTIRIFNDNYEGQYSGSFEIKPIEITITVLLYDATDDSYKSSVSIDYGNSFPAYKVVVTDKNGEEYKLDAELSVSKPVLLKAGVHEVTTSFDDEHYTTTIEGASLTVNKVDLNPGEPELILSEEGITFGDKLSGILFKEHQLGYWKWDLSGGDSVGNAGKNTVTAIFVPKDSSYNEYEYKYDITVNRKKLTFDITSSSTFTFNGKEHGLTYDVIDPNSREVVSGLKVLGNERFVNAGTYSVTLEFEDTNYQAIENTFKLTILQATTEVDFSFIVDDVWFQGITLSDIPLPNGYKWNNPGTSINKPGEYAYEVTFYPDDANYATSSGELKIALDKATPTLTTDKNAYSGYTYKASEYKLSTIITHSSNSDMVNNVEYYISGTNEKVTALVDAGEYSIDVVIPESDKYKSVKTNVIVVVSKANPSLDCPTIDSWTYGSEAVEPTSGSNQVKIAGFHYYTEECGQYTRLDGVPTNAGTYYVTAYSLETDNYYAAESEYKQFTIDKYVVERPTLVNGVYTGGYQSANVPASTLYKVAENGNPDRLNAGTYDVTLELLDSDNYVWDNGDESTTKVSYVIDRATITLSAITGSSSFYYLDSLDFASSKTYTTEHVTDFGKIVYLYASAATPNDFSETVPTVVGTYYVKAVIYADEDNNWKATETAPVRFEITQRPTGVPTLSGTTAVFDGSVFSPDVVELDSVIYADNGEKIYTVEYQNVNSVNKGEYRVTLTMTNSNFKWEGSTSSVATLTYTITAATPELYDIVSSGWTFGTPITHSASAKITSENTDVEDYLINVENAVTVRYYNLEKSPINKPTNAGTYYVRFDIAEDSTNGNWVSVTGDYIEFVIEQFALDIPELDGTGIYTYTGSDITLTVKENAEHKDHYSTSGNVQQSVGSYTAVYSLENNNYKWKDETTTNKTIDYTIAQATTSVTGLTIAGWTFNDSASTPSYTAKTNTDYTIPESYVRISFRKQGTEEWTTITPSEWATNGPEYAGDYDVKVAVISDTEENWKASESDVLALNIAKDTYDMSGVMWNYTSAFTFDKDNAHTVSITGTLPNGVTVKEYTGNSAQNAGDYTANVKFSYDSDNYNEPTIASLEWTIDPQIVNKPSKDTTTFVYTGSSQTYGISAHEGYTRENYEKTDAGTYVVTLTLNNTETVKNYIWDDETYDAETYDFVIAPKALEVSFVTLTNSLEFISTTTELTQEIQVKFGNEVLVLGTDYTVTGNVQTNAGNYEMTVTAQEGSNYTGSVSISYTVGRQPIEKPSAATGLAFNNGAQNSGIATVDGVWTAVDTAIAATVNGVTPAGDYKVTVTLNSNYKWSDGTTADLELSYTIDKATITLKDLTAQYPNGATSWTFGDTVVYKAYKADSTQTFGTIVYHFQKEGSEVWSDTTSGEGTYYVRASIANDDNWYDVEPIYTSFTLNKKALTADNVDHTYNDLVYTGSVLDGSVTVTANGGTLVENTDYTVSIDKTVKNAGTYTITVTGKGNYSGTVTKTFDVAKKALSEISTTHTYHNNDAEKTTLVYTGTAFGDRVVLEYGELTLVKGTDYTISITEDGESADSVKNAGNYVIVVTAAENGNYSGSVTITFAVDVKTVDAPEFAADVNTTLVYDHSATDANQPKLTDSADKDYYTVTYPTFNKNVGTYEIGAALKSEHGDNIKWSDDTTADKTFSYEIVKKEISDSDVSHTYNNLIYTGSDISGTVTVTVNGKVLVAGTDYDLSIDKTVHDADDYVITVTGKGNYKGTVTKSFNVAPAEESVSFSKIEGTAGTFANGTLTLTYSGEVDIRNFITATLKKSATAALTSREPVITGYELSNKGEYTVTYKYAATTDGNYAEVSGSIKVVINAVTTNKITLTANYVDGKLEWRYEDAVKYSASAAFGQSDISVVYYELENGVYVEMEDFVPGETILAHGDYKVVATLAGNGNYNGDEVEIEFTVKKKLVPVSAKNSTYDGYSHNSGLTDNDYYTVSEHSTDNVEHGTYKVTVTLKNPANCAWSDTDSSVSKTLEYQIAARANELSDYKLLDKDGNSVTNWTHDDVITHTASVLYKADGDTVGYVVEYKAQADKENDSVSYTTGLPTAVGTYVVRFRTTDENATIEYGYINNVTITAKSESAPVIAGKTYDNTDYETGLESIEGIYTVSGTVTAKDAGTYTVVLTLVDSVNHKWTLPETVPANSTYTLSGDNDGTLTITYQITTRTVTVSSVTASKNEWIFDEENASLTPTPAVTINGITFTYTYTFYMWNDATGKYDIPVEDADDISDINNVGKYQVVVALVSAENNDNSVKNYEAGDTASTTFEIKQLVLSEVTLSETTREFNNTEFKPTVNGVNSKYCKEPVYAGTDASFINYGSYTATVSIKDEYVGNVVLHNNSSSVSLDYKITSAKPSISGLVAGTWTYDENLTVIHSATVTVPSGTLKAGTDYKIVYYTKNGESYVKYGETSLTAPAHGDYYVRVEVSAAANLNWSATDSEYVKFTVEQQGINVPEVNASRPFNNGTQTSGWVTVNGKWTVVDTGVDKTEEGVTPVGDYTATITLNNNYQWNAIPEGVTNVEFDKDNAQIVYVTYSITAIDISTDSVNKVANYKAENGENLSYTGNELGSLTLAFGTATLVEDTDYTVSITRDGNSADSVKNAGDYVITVTGKGNYTGTYTVEFTVDRQTLTVPVVGNFVYNESTTAQKPAISIEGNKLPTDTVIVNNGGVNVAEYTATLTLTDTSFANHKWGALPANAKLSKDEKTVTITYEITPKPIDAPVVSASRTFNNGTQTSGWVTVNGKWTVVDTGVDKTEEGVTPVGDYTAVITLNDNYKWNAIPDGVTNVEFDKDNAQIVYVTYSITAKSLADNDITVSHNYTGLTYGDSLDGKEVTVKFGTTELVEGQDFEVIFGGKSTTVGDAGTYTVTVKGMGNYANDRAGGNFTITAATAKFETIEDTAWNNKEFGSVNATAPSPEVFLENNTSVKVEDATVNVYYKLQSDVAVATFSIEEDPWIAAGWILWTKKSYPNAVGKYDILVVVVADEESNYNTDKAYSQEFEIEILKATTSINGTPTISDSEYNEYTGPSTEEELLSGVTVKRTDGALDNPTINVDIEFTPYVTGTVWDGTIGIAGSYTITYSYDGDDSHNAAKDVVISFEIKKADTTIEGVKNGQTIDESYDGNNHLPTVTINGTTATPEISYTAPEGYSCDEPTNGVTAGTYTLTYSFAGDNNYDSMTNVVVTLNIAQVQQVVDENTIGIADEIVYGSNANAVITLPTGVTGGEWKLYDSNKTTLATTVGNATSSGEYNVFYARFESSDVNYASTDYIKIEIQVAKADTVIDVPTIENSEYNFIYTYSNTDYLQTIKNEITITTDGTVAWNWNGATEVKNAGEYTVTITVSEGVNYESTSAEVKIYVNPKALTSDDVSLDSSLTYTGSEQTMAVTVKGVNNTTLNVWNETTESGDYTITGNKATCAVDENGNVITYIVIVTGKGNYSGTVEKTYTIGVKSVTAPYWASGTDLEYTFGETFTAPKPTDSGDRAYYKVTAPTSSTNAGKYTYVVSLNTAEHGANIVWASGTVTNTSGQVELSYEINAKALVDDNLTLSGDVTYSGSEQKHTATVIVNGTTLTKDTDYTVSYSTTNNYTDVGTITVTVTGKGNYSGTITKTYEIKQDTITVDAIGNLTYNGTTQAPTVTLTASNSTIAATTVTVTNAGGKNAGNYSVTITLNDTVNYTLIYSGTNGTINGNTLTISYSITPVEITVSTEKSGAEVTYKAAAFTSSDILVLLGTISAEGIVSGDTVTYKLVDSDGNDIGETVKNASTTSYTLKIASANSNYNVANTVTISVTINKATPAVGEPTYSGEPYKNLLSTSLVVSGTASVAGTHTVSNDYSVSDGTATFTVTFNPTDSTNYNSVVKTLNVALEVVATHGDTSYYSLEDALENVTSGEIWVTADSTGNIVLKASREIRSGVTLILPYDENGGRNTNGDSDGTFAANFATADKLKTKIVIANGVVLTVNGTLEVNGVMSGGVNGGKYAGATTGNYAELVIQGSAQIICNNGGVIRASGFITSEYGDYSPSDDKPSIYVNSGGKLYQPLIIHDYQSGNYFAAIGYNDFNGKDPMSDLGMLPFSETSFYNVQPFMRINHGAQMISWANLDTSRHVYGGFEIGGPQHSEATFIGYVGGSQHFIQLKENAYITTEIKDPSTEVISIDMYGGMQFGEFKLTLTVAIMTVTATSLDSFFPFSWAYDVTLHDGTYELDAQRVKFMWGSKLTIEEDAIVDASNTSIMIYDLDDLTMLNYKIDNQTSGTNYIQKYGCGATESIYKKEAKLIVKGTLIANSLGGKVYAEGENAKIKITSSGVSTNEAVSYTADTFNSVLNEIYTINNSVVLCGNEQALTMSNGGTYEYDAENNKWIVPSITVKFDTDGGSNHYDVTASRTDDYYYNTGLASLPTPTKTGAGFLGWYIDSGFTTPVIFENGIIKNATGDVTTLYAYWLPDKIYISFDANGGTVNDGASEYNNVYTYNVDTKTFDGTFTIPTMDARAGYIFLGWYTDETYTTPVDSSTFGESLPYETRDFAIYAKWMRTEATVEYNSNEGTAVSSTTLTYIDGSGNQYEGNISDEIPELYGFVFAGWYLYSDFSGNEIEAGQLYTHINSLAINYSEPAEIKVKLYAKWVRKDLSITYDYAGGTLVGEADTTLTVDENSLDDGTFEYYVTLPTLKIPGYKLLGWYSGDTRVGGAGDTYSYTTKNFLDESTFALTAKWEAIEYTVSFENEYDSDITWGDTKPTFTKDPITFSGSDYSYALEAQVAEGYTWGGWYVLNGETKVPITAITAASIADYANEDGTITIYGEWSMANTYTFTFVHDNENVTVSVSAITATWNNMTGQTLVDLAATYNTDRAFAYEFVKYQFNGKDVASFEEIKALIGSVEPDESASYEISVIWTEKYTLTISGNNGLSDAYAINFSESTYLSSAEVTDNVKASYKSKYSPAAYDAQVLASKYFTDWTETTSDKAITITAGFADKIVITISYGGLLDTSGNALANDVRYVKSGTTFTIESGMIEKAGAANGTTTVSVYHTGNWTNATQSGTSWMVTPTANVTVTAELGYKVKLTLDTTGNVTYAGINGAATEGYLVPGTYQYTVSGVNTDNNDNIKVSYYYDGTWTNAAWETGSSEIINVVLTGSSSSVAEVSVSPWKTKHSVTINATQVDTYTITMTVNGTAYTVTETSYIKSTDTVSFSITAKPSYLTKVTITLTNNGSTKGTTTSSRWANPFGSQPSVTLNVSSSTYGTIVDGKTTEIKFS